MPPDDGSGALPVTIDDLGFAAKRRNVFINLTVFFIICLLFDKPVKLAGLGNEIVINWYIAAILSAIFLGYTLIRYWQECNKKVDDALAQLIASISRQYINGILEPLIREKEKERGRYDAAQANNILLADITVIRVDPPVTPMKYGTTKYNIWYNCRMTLPGEDKSRVMSDQSVEMKSDGLHARIRPAEKDFILRQPNHWDKLAPFVFTKYGVILGAIIVIFRLAMRLVG